MDRRTTWTGPATLVVALLTLAVATALLLRPLPEVTADGSSAVQSLRRDVGALRGDIAELRTLVERAANGEQPVDLSSLETRLDGLEASMRGMTDTIQTIASSAATICQLVADSPFTPGSTC